MFKGLIAERLEARIRERGLLSALDARLHEGQRRFVLSTAFWRALKSSRRFGKSSGSNILVLRTALRTPNARVFCVNETLAETERIVWDGGNDDGLAFLLDHFKIVHDYNKSKRVLTLPNGAIVRLLGADSERQINKARGTPFHLLWLDEAQKLRHLNKFVNDVAAASQKDFGGVVLLTGTPSEDIASEFYEITRDQGERKKGWTVFEGSVLENPWFGDTPEERYQRVIQAELDRTGKDISDPVIQRELFARWVLSDALYIYPVHRIPPHILHFAPARLLDDGRIDIHAAIKDLPLDKYGRPREWRFGIGVDRGFSPDPFAIVAGAFSRGHRRLYEIGSWTKHKLLPDAQIEELERVYRTLCEYGPVLEAVADASGGKDVVAGWSAGMQGRTGIPITEAKKSNKREFIDHLGGDYEMHRIALREGGELSREVHGLPWKVTGTGERVENDTKNKDGTKKYPNHAADGWLYMHRAIAPYLQWEIDDEPKTKDQREEERIKENLEGGDDEDAWLPL